MTVSGSPSRAAVDLAEELLESVISNLLDNVVLHCPSGVTVELATSFVGGFLELCVTDTGPGISEANQTKVFQPFFTTARKRGGSGLGLSIVLAIVKAHHGSVRLESSESGTKVRIVLPAAAA